MTIKDGTITGASILIVDDDPAIRDALAEGIDLIGINLAISTAVNAITAIQVAKEVMPDVIVLDYNMPYGDGFMVAKEIRAMPDLKHTKIIMLTAQDSHENHWASFEKEIDSFIGKPVDLGDVEALIYSLLIKTQQSLSRGRLGQA